MRNVDVWVPTKYQRDGARFRASRDPEQLSVGSRLIGQLLVDRYASLFSCYMRGRLADLGCGQVPFYEMYHELVGSIVTVDWAHSQHGNRFVDVSCDLAAPLPFGDGCFDTILLSDVLEHLRSPDTLLGESFRTLAAGGHLIGNVPFYYPLHEHPYDFYRFTEFGLRHLAEKVGFDVVAIEPVGGALEVLGDLLSKLTGRIRPLRPLAKTIAWAILALGRTSWGRKQMVRTAYEFPLGYVMVLRRPAY